MVIEQQKFFEWLNFKKYEFEYKTGKRVCYKGPDGVYYRVDHFANSYVIESAQNEIEAQNNCFEGDDLFDDSLNEREIIELIQIKLKEYVLNDLPEMVHRSTITSLFIELPTPENHDWIVSCLNIVLFYFVNCGDWLYYLVER